MDIDEPFRPPSPPPAVREPKRRCFCCGRTYGTRQLARHLRAFLARVEEEMAAAQAAGFSDDEDEDDDGDSYPHNAGMDLDYAAAAEEDWMPPGQDGDGIFDNAGADAGHHDAQPYVEPEHVHEPRRNPPVEIRDWPDYDKDDAEAASEDEEPVDGPDQDPAFKELPVQPPDAHLNPLYEPDMADEQVRAIMRLELGDLADDEWLNLYDEALTPHDENTFRFLSTRLRTHFSRQTYDELRYGPCEQLGIPSEFIAYRRLRIASGLETRMYDMCVGSCCCFLGKYENLDACPFCHER
ncbi:hypothetical protein FRC12_013807 [Ceratobasidium sp. 428]|nr:hypothetical protein FRC12_013807 [Ceratobasidium sp. 428]